MPLRSFWSESVNFSANTRTYKKVSVSKVNVTPNRDSARSYRSYYTPKLQAQVANWYQPEIQLLGYEF